jgi:hypothetical protein
MYGDRHHDDRVAFWCAAPAGVQEGLVTTAPARSSGRLMSVVAAGRGLPRRRRRGPGREWTGTRVDRDEIGEVVLDAYRVIAPPKLTALLD